VSGDARLERYRRTRRGSFAARVRAWKNITLILVLISLALVLVGIGNLYIAYAMVKANIERIVNIDLPQGSQATRIYGRDYNPKTKQGTLLGSLFLENRQQASYSEIPPQLIACVLSTEDKNFFQHGGVDMLGTARAVLKGALRGGGGSIRGTSTITQQLSRNVFLPYIKSDRTLNRKIQEVILSGALERRFEKWEILEAYLNHIFLGSNAYGMRSAAMTYFGKDLNQLSLSECALLAGLPQSPSKYNPYKHPESALARRESVLKLLDSRVDSDFFDNLRAGDLEKFGKLKLTHEEIRKAMDEPLKLSKKSASGLIRAQYFTTWLTENVLAPRYGENVNNSTQGLVVISTIDPQFQSWAEQVVAQELDKDRKAKRVSQAALVLIEARTGEVLACVGGYKWRAPNASGAPDVLNRALQSSRQVGSSFKPFTYSTAYEQGFDPSTLVNDAPQSQIDGKPWPNNSDGTYRGWMSMYYALQYSRNAAATDVIMHLTGVPAVIDMARKMGIKSNLPEVAALTLGAADIKPVEMAEAFDTFPNMGRHVQHVLIKKVYNEGGILIENNESLGAIDERSNRAMSENTAYMMVQNMIRVVEAGTGKSARVPGVEIAGKTGTCDDFRDAWFVGYSPELVCAVWVGNDDWGKPMNHMFGGSLPARIFSGVMKKIYTKQSAKTGEGQAATETVTYASRYSKTKFEKPAGATFTGFRGGSAGSAVKGSGEEAASAEPKKDGSQGDTPPPDDDSGFYDPYQPPPEGHVYF
jgi:penicillin-binding protein 1A